MSLRQLQAPLLLIVIQTVPSPVQVTNDGTGHRLTLAAGSGQYEERTLGCDGQVLETVPRPVRAGGAAIDLWPSPNTRISVAGGVHRDPGENDGVTAAVQGAHEGRRGGIGLGVAVLGNTRFRPSLYGRLGPMDQAHFRIEAAQPSATGPLHGDVRAGFAWNQGLNDRVWSYVGYSHGLYSDRSHIGGFFGEIRLPVGGRVAFTTGASWRPSDKELDAAAHVGLSLLGGRR